MTVPPQTPFLLVDDDLVSLMAIKRALRKLGIDNPVETARDGLEALELLDTRAKAADGELPPHIATLDMNMPRMNGKEFLDAVALRPTLKKLDIFMFVASDRRTDVSASHSHQLAGYLEKDDLFASLSQALFPDHPV